MTTASVRFTVGAGLSACSDSVHINTEAPWQPYPSAPKQPRAWCSTAWISVDPEIFGPQNVL